MEGSRVGFLPLASLVEASMASAEEDEEDGNKGEGCAIEANKEGSYARRFDDNDGSGGGVDKDEVKYEGDDNDSDYRIAEEYDQDDHRDRAGTTSPPSSYTQYERYDPRRPKWWRIRKGRRPTRAQIGCVRRMSDCGYVIAVPRSARPLHESPACSSFDPSLESPNADSGDCRPLDWDRIWRTPIRRRWVQGTSGDGGLFDGENAATDASAAAAVNEDDAAAAALAGYAGGNNGEKWHHVDNDNQPHRKQRQQQTLERETWLEIGFGDGENLQELARRYPHRRYVGAEVFPGGAGRILRRVEDEISAALDAAATTTNIMTTTTNGNDGCRGRRAHHPWKANRYYKGEDEGGGNSCSCPSSLPSDPAPAPAPSTLSYEPALPYDNLRIYPGDGMKLLRLVPSQCLNAVLLTFPDPFPKHIHRRWRVLQDDTIAYIERALVKPAATATATATTKTTFASEKGGDGDGKGCGSRGGRLFLATDSIEFAEWAEEIIDRRNRRRLVGRLGTTTATTMTETSTTAEAAAADEMRKGVVVWERIDPLPDRITWLPVVSRYESEGWMEGRTTKLKCWRLVVGGGEMMTERDAVWRKGTREGGGIFGGLDGGGEWGRGCTEGMGCGVGSLYGATEQ